MPKINPLISVIVPVYKVEQYLRRCVDSVLTQTYQNLEVVLVDDGSPDRCGAICDEYAKKDSRIGVIHQENRGLSAARNAGLDACTGQFVTFVDSDDYIERDLIQRLFDGIGDADLCGCGVIREEQSGEIISVTKTADRIALPGKNVLCQHYTGENGRLGIAAVAVWAKLYRKELWEGLRFYEGLMFEDMHIMPFLLGKCETARYIPYAGYHYLVTPGSITNNQNEQHQRKCYEDCFHIWVDHEALYQRQGWDDLLTQVDIVRAEKLIAHISKDKVPQGYEGWSKKLLHKTVAKLLTKPIGMRCKVRYGTFCLIGKNCYRLIKKYIGVRRNRGELI